MRQQCDTGAMLRFELADLFLQLTLTVIFPRQDSQTAFLQEVFELLPLIKAQQHVRSEG